MRSLSSTIRPTFEIAVAVAVADRDPWPLAQDREFAEQGPAGEVGQHHLVSVDIGSGYRNPILVDGIGAVDPIPLAKKNISRREQQPLVLPKEIVQPEGR